MAKINIDLRKISERASGRRRTKRTTASTDTSSPNKAPKGPGELPAELAAKGWRVKRAAKGKKQWPRKLGSVLKCPHCGHTFISPLCKVTDKDTAYWSKHWFGEKSIAEYEMRRIFLLEGKFPETPEGSGMKDFVRCWYCQRISPKARWLVKHVFDNSVYPHAVTIEGDDNTTQPDPGQSAHLQKRMAQIDEIANESEAQQSLESDPKPNEEKE